MYDYHALDDEKRAVNTRFMSPEMSPGTANLGRDDSLVVLSEGVKHDAFELAARILAAWEAFIAQHVVPESI